jgi:hypothetical protein
MQKKLTITLLIYFTLTAALFSQGEQLVINLACKSAKRLFKFENPKGSVKVIGYDGNDIVINAGFRYTGPEISDAKGLRRIDKNNINISAETNGNTITLFNRTDDKTIDFNIKIPKDFSLNLNALDNGIVEVLNIDGDIEVENANGDISLGNIKGSSVLSTIYGKISASFSEVKPDTPMMFTSFEGDISLFLPVNVNAVLKMKTGTGEIHTDFDLIPRKKEAMVKNNGKSTVYSLEDWTTGSINNGGPEYIVRSYSGNITIKKNNPGNF